MFTPGPYEATPGGRWIYDTKDGRYVAEVQVWNREDNARLLKAAPRMYEALKEAVAWLTETQEGRNVPQVDGNPGTWLHKAWEALAEAEGRNV